MGIPSSHSSHPARRLRGAVWGDMVVDQRLGEGSAAVVYRVWHRPSSTWQALKLLHSEHAELRARLQQEARMQAAIDHAHVVKVFDVSALGDDMAVRMEYVRGPTLEAWLARGRPDRREALAVFRGVALGVGAAHQQGLVHRDLKPANILLRVDDDVVVPLVADFGLAKSLVAGPLLTRPGAGMGTPAYMAPEQFVDAGEVDRRADIWSLGVLLYELTTGQRPFPESDLFDLMRHVARGDVADPRQHVPDLPVRLVEAIEGCLAVDKRERFHDVSQLLAFIDHCPETAFVQRAETVHPLAPSAHSRRTVGLDRSRWPADLVPRLPARPPHAAEQQATVGRVMLASALVGGATTAGVMAAAAVGVWLAF